MEEGVEKKNERDFDGSSMGFSFVPHPPHARSFSLCSRFPWRGRRTAVVEQRKTKRTHVADDAGSGGAASSARHCCRRRLCRRRRERRHRSRRRRRTAETARASAPGRGTRESFSASPSGRGGYGRGGGARVAEREGRGFAPRGEGGGRRRDRQRHGFFSKCDFIGKNSKHKSSSFSLFVSSALLRGSKKPLSSSVFSFHGVWRRLWEQAGEFARGDVAREIGEREASKEKKAFHHRFTSTSLLTNLDLSLPKTRNTKTKTACVGLGLPPTAPAAAAVRVRWRRLRRRRRRRRRLRRRRRRLWRWRRQQHRLPLCPTRRRRRQLQCFFLGPGERLALRRPPRRLHRAPALAPVLLRPRAAQGLRLRGGRLVRGGALAAAERRRGLWAGGAVAELGVLCPGEEGPAAELRRGGAAARGAAASGLFEGGRRRRSWRRSRRRVWCVWHCCCCCSCSSFSAAATADAPVRRCSCCCCPSRDPGSSPRHAVRADCRGVRRLWAPRGRDRQQQHHGGNGGGIRQRDSGIRGQAGRRHCVWRRECRSRSFRGACCCSGGGSLCLPGRSRVWRRGGVWRPCCRSFSCSVWRRRRRGWRLWRRLRRRRRCPRGVWWWRREAAAAARGPFWRRRRSLWRRRQLWRRQGRGADPGRDDELRGQGRAPPGSGELLRRRRSRSRRGCLLRSRFWRSCRGGLGGVGVREGQDPGRGAARGVLPLS